MEGGQSFPECGQEMNLSEAETAESKRQWRSQRKL